MEGNADIAVGAMTINFARESVIDFTKVVTLGFNLTNKIINLVTIIIYYIFFAFLYYFRYRYLKYKQICSQNS